MNGSNLFQLVRVKLRSPAKAQFGHLGTDHRNCIYDIYLYVCVYTCILGEEELFSTL